MWLLDLHPLNFCYSYCLGNKGMTIFWIIYQGYLFALSTRGNGYATIHIRLGTLDMHAVIVVSILFFFLDEVSVCVFI